MNYSSLNDKEKKKVLKQKYIKEKLSFAEIAKEFGTYANKLRRDASKLGIEIRTRSQAAKIALECGRSEHISLFLVFDFSADVLYGTEHHILVG